MKRLSVLVLAMLTWALPVSAQTASKAAWAPVQGEVELDPARALASAERKARERAWQEYGTLWLEVAGPLVPAERARSELKAWLARSLPESPALRHGELARFQASVGDAYRQSSELALRGPDAEKLRGAGSRRARDLRRIFHRRYLVIALLWLALYFVAGKVDRATQGYLTWRIRAGALAISAGLAFALWPHAAILLR